MKSKILIILAGILVTGIVYAAETKVNGYQLIIDSSNYFLGFGTTTLSSNSLGILASTTDIFSVFPAPPNMATPTPTYISNYEPVSIPTASGTNITGIYSDDITRMIAQNITAAGNMYLLNSSLIFNNLGQEYAGATGTTAQIITAQSVLGSTTSVWLGGVTSLGYHYVMGRTTTSGLVYIYRATSSFSSDLSLSTNWATSTISGTQFVTGTLGIVGVSGGNTIWVASSTNTELDPYTISGNTLTAGTPITITGAAITLINTRVNNNGLYVGFAAAPFIRKYSLAGQSNITYGNLGVAAVAAPGPSFFGMKNSIYIKDSANLLSKILGW